MRGRISRSSVPSKWEPKDALRHRLAVPAAAPEQTTHAASSAKEVDAGQAHHRGTRRGEGGANIPAEQPELPQGPPSPSPPTPQPPGSEKGQIRGGGGIRPLVPQSQKNSFGSCEGEAALQDMGLGWNLRGKNPFGEKLRQSLGHILSCLAFFRMK